ncbi:MAG: exopolysaccharide biosynthesis protein [Pseudomonadota bacterium]
MSETVTPRTFLQSLEAMANDAPAQGYALRDILDRLDERAFGAGLFVLALPCAIPFLWGVPQIVALPMLFLTLQMLSGRSEPWLPQRMGARMIDKDGLSRTTKFGRKWFGWLETISNPRLLFLSSRPMEPVLALFLTVFSSSILIPLPGTNTVPGIAVAIVAFGLMARDGILIFLGLVIGSAWISALVFGGSQVLGYITGLLGG